MISQRDVSCRLLGMIGLVFLTGLAAFPQARQAVTVNGRVFLPDNQPAVQITVNISGQNGFTASTKTDGRGGYRFEGMPASVYTLRVTPPQNAAFYADSTSVDTTRDGNLFTVDIFLRNPLEASTKNDKGAKLISIKEASQQVPREARKSLDRAKKFREQKKYDAALAELDKALSLYPDYFQAFTERGVVQINAGRLQEALPNFNKALELFPDYEPALSGAGYCLLTMGQYEGSISHLEKAVNLDAAHTQNYLFLGIANLALNRWQTAQHFLERTLKLDASAINAHMYLADAYAGQRLYARAADELRTYLEKNPQAPNADRLRQREKSWRSQQPPRQ